MIRYSFLTPADAEKINLDDLDSLVAQLTASPVKHNLTSFRRFLNQPRLFQLAAFADQHLVGLASLFVVRKIEVKAGLIEGVVVDKKYRRQGIGTKMMKMLIEKARQVGVKHLDLTSHPSRVAANRLYRRLGFHPRQTNLYRLDLS